MNPASVKFSAASLLLFGESLLAAAGLSADRARDVAEVLLEGDLLGHTTHGFALLPAYLKALQENTMEKEGEPLVVSDHGSALTWDGRYLPGPWLVRRAIAVAQSRIAAHPVVTVVIRRSHHIACLQAFLKPVTDDGLLILLYSSDPASRVVAPHGGIVPCFSPNPLAAGIPTNSDPILIDISTSTTAHGVVKQLGAANQRLPGEWLIDREGKATDDPRVLSEGRGGALLPLGGMDSGHKGFALAIVVEALTNALGGHGRADTETRWSASVFLQLINPDCFGGRENFLRETSFFAETCRATPVAPGKPPVRLPGQAALARRAEQLANVVELHPSIMPALIPLAEIFHVEVPSVCG